MLTYTPQAFQELARGERTATALENQLSAMESRIEELLAQAERDHQEVENMRAQRSSAGEAGVGQSEAGPDGNQQGGHA